MRRKKKKLRLIIAAVPVLILCLITITGKWQIIGTYLKHINLMPLRGYEEVKIESGRPMDTVLSMEEVLEDLKQLEKDLLEAHYATGRESHFELKTAIDKAYAKLKKESKGMSIHDFSIMTSEITNSLKDSHTGMVTVNQEAKLIPIRFVRVDGKFYVTEGVDIEAGSEWIEAGGIPLTELYDFHKKIKSAENDYWLEATFYETLNYERIKSLGGELKSLDNGSLVIPLKLKVNGAERIVEVNSEDPWRTMERYTDYHFSKDREYAYYTNIEADYTHFIFPTCNVTEWYSQFLIEMFTDIKNKQIGNLIIDLRGNSGGNSDACDEVLAYIIKEKVVQGPSFSVRFSEQASAQRGYFRKKGYMDVDLSEMPLAPFDASLNFKGNVYVLVDNLTFSSGVYMAMMVLDNEIGTVVGTPTGGSPESYGDILIFQLKNSRLPYTISHKIFNRPNKARSTDDALYPDYEVRYTLQDYLDKRDLELEKVVECIKRQSY